MRPSPTRGNRYRRAILVAVISLIIVGGGGYAAIRFFEARPTATPSQPQATPAPAVTADERSRVSNAQLGNTLLTVTELTADRATLGVLTVNQAQVSGNLTVTGDGDFGGTIEAANFVGDGSGLTGVNAAQLGGQPAAFYQNIANLNGQVRTDQLPDSVALRNAANTFTATNSFAGLLSASGTVNITGPATLSGSTTISNLTLGSALPVSSGGTGLTDVAQRGIMYGQGGGALGVAVPAGAGLCLVSGASDVQWGVCGGGGSGVTSVNGLTGAITVANASTAGSTITLDDATTGAKGIASFNATNFSVTSGAVNTVQNINSGATPTFAGVNTNAITPSAALAIGSITQALTMQGAATSITANSGGNVTTLSFQAPTANVTYRLLTTGAGTYDICTTAGNCVGTGGGVSTSGGTTNRLAKFTGVQSIADSLITDNGATVSVGGDFNVTGSVTLTTALAVDQGGTGATGASGARTNLGAAASGANSDITSLTALSTALSVGQGGTGATSLTSNGVIIGQGTGALAAVTAGGNGLCLMSTAGAPSFQACPGSGGPTGVTSLNSLTGALSVANATAAGSTITIDDATTGAKGIASFNSTNFSVTTGAVNTIQNISTASTPTFAGVNTTAITPGAALTIGATGQSFTVQGNASSVFTATNGANTTTVSFASPTANVNYRFLAAAAGTYDICTTAGNCVGTGGGVSTSGGTTNAIPKFTAAQTLGDSIISDNGSTVTIGGALAVNTITPTGALTVGATAQNLTLQGAVVNLTATSGGTTNTLTFATPSGAAKTITVPNATGTLAVSASGPLAIDAAGNITCASCVTSGGGSGGVGAVDSLNSLTGVLTLANASGAGSTITINDATTGAKGIASFNSTNFSVTGGAVNTVQNIATTASPTFSNVTTSADLVVQGGDLTVGTAAQIASLYLHDGNGQITTIQAGNSGGNLTFILPTTAGSTNQCLKQSGTGNQLFWDSCDGGAGGSSGVSSLNSLTGALTVANATTAGSTITIDDATTGAKGIASFNSTNFSVTSGAVNTVQNINTSASPTFASLTLSGDLAVNGGDITSTGALNLTPGGALVIGATNQTLTMQGNGTTRMRSTNAAGTFTNTLQFATPGSSNKTITIPNATGMIAVSASLPLSLDINGNLTCTTCVTDGGGSGGVAAVDSLNTLTGDITIANASTAGSTITLNDATTGAKGIASFNSTNFSVSSGAVNTVQGIATTSAPSFAGLTLTGDTLLQPTSDSRFAFRVLNASTGRIMRIDSISQKVAIGSYNTASADNIAAQLEVIPTSDNRIGITVTGASATQAGDYFQAVNPSTGNMFRVQSSGDVQTATGVFMSNAQTAASTNSSGANYKSGDVSGATSNSGVATFSSGNSTTSGNTGAVTLKSGNATSGTSGSVTVDAGSGTTATGGIFIGTAQSTAVTIGRTNGTTTTTLQGTTVTLEAAGSSTSGVIQIGQGGAGNTTPDVLGLGVKSTTGDPAGGAEGQMYYNTLDNKFRCYQGSGWTDCIAGAGATPTLQQAYDASSDPEFTLDATRGALTVRDNSSALGTNLLEVKNNALTTTYFGVNASGATVTGDVVIRNAETATKQYRWRTSGADLDFDIGGADMHFSTYPNADFTGTQHQQIVLHADGGNIELQRSTQVAGSMIIDAANVNSGTVANFLQFGTAGGQGVGSKRTAGGNQNGLDFYTNSTAVMQLTNAGAILLNGDTTLAAGKSLTVTGGVTGTRPSSPAEGMVYYDTDTDRLLTYAGGKWQADRSSATKIVAMGATTGCSGSVPVASQNADAADFVSTSCTSAQTVINSALTALPAGGGTVFLMDGTYIIDGSISVPSNVTLAGAGTGTVIKFKNAINASINGIINSDTSAGNLNVVLRDFKIDGNKANQSSGSQYAVNFTKVGTSNSTRGGEISGLTIENAFTHGIYTNTSFNVAINKVAVLSSGNSGVNIATGSSQISISDSRIELSSISGIVTDSAASRITMTNNTLTSNSSYGINSTSPDSIISGNTSRCIYVNGIRSTVSHNFITGCGGSFDGIKVSGNDILVTDNQINTSGDAGIGMQFGPSGVRIIDNVITGTYFNNYAIDVRVSSGTPSNTYISGNTFASGLSINDAGVNTTFANQVTGNNNLAVKGLAGVSVNSVTATASMTLQGGLQVTQLPAPTAPTVTNIGTAGSTSYTYAVTANDGLGETVVSTATTTNTGNATLTAGNYNRISWNRVSGAISYKVYRTASSGSPATTGLIGTVAASSAVMQLNDTALAASGAAPTANATGGMSLASNFVQTDGTWAQTYSGTSDAHVITLSSTSGIQGNGVLINHSGAGTTSNGMFINNSAGTLTNGLSFGGTIGADINRQTGTLTMQGTGGISLLSTSGNISIGTSDTVGTLLVLDTKTDSADPTGVNGGMYYNSALKGFRCYEDGQWRFCNEPRGLSNGYRIEEDFMNWSANDAAADTMGDLGWVDQGTLSGDSTKVSATDPNHPGIILLFTGTDTTSGVQLSLGGNGGVQEQVMIGGGETLEAGIQIETLADATNDFAFKAGLCDTLGGNCTDGLYFEYDRSASATVWRMGAASNGTTTESATSTTVTTGWVNLKIKVNSAGTSAEYFINGASVGTVSASIPDGRTTAPAFQIRKTAGTSNRNVLVDYFNLYATFANGR